MNFFIAYTSKRGIYLALLGISCPSKKDMSHFLESQYFRLLEIQDVKMYCKLIKMKRMNMLNFKRTL